jgi:predicted metalloprotease with PDZ domain
MSIPRYRVRIAPNTHQLEIELTVPGLAEGSARFEVPTWVPGAYGFMKYARDLFELRAFDEKSGEALSVTREGWSGFRVDRVKGGVRLAYRANASDVSFGELTGIVEHHQAVLLGTRYLYAVGQVGPCEVDYELPKGWGLHHPAGAKKLSEHRYEYPSYAALLDAPVVAGQFEVITRSSHGVEFSHLFLDRAVGFETEAQPFVDAVMKVAEGCHQVFGSYPFDRYSFIYTFGPDAHWGLEHANATMIALGEQGLFDPQQRASGIRVCAHELFHAWNVCRLKPAPLGRLDHVRGSFPDALWVAEGFTRYYEFLLSVRARELSVEDFFSNVVNYWRHLTAMPAHARVSATDSSLATFLNHNKYPGSINNTIDYYDKGMLVAFDLDVLLHGKGTSLDQTFSAFYSAFVGKGEGFTTAQLRDFFGERAREAAQLIRDEVETPGGLSVPQKLEQLGFQLERGKVRYLGLVLDKNAGPVIANVLDTAPAGQSGLMAGDSIVKVDGFPFELKALKWLIGHRSHVAIEVKRGHRYFRFDVPTSEREDATSLIWRGTPEQAERIRTWLKRDDFQPHSAQKFPLTAFENFHGIQTVL